MSRVIRVGFVFDSSPAGWLGGINYLKNLMRSVSQEFVDIEPVALVPSSRSDATSLQGIKEVRTDLFWRRSLARWARLAIRETIGRDVMVERMLRAHGIAVISHSGVLGPRSPMPTINWIPDLQHRRLPTFFDADELKSRDKYFGRMCKLSTLLIASSECARRDIETFFPTSTGKVRVLRFVATSAAEAPTTDSAVLEQRYAPGDRYFLVPNQFWAHKNHGVIIEALRILRSRGHRVQVLATGNTADYRRPTYFPELMRRRDESGLESDFRCLGVIPYEDVASLARNAVALINPSLFEGWSTSVEEAKTLGKPILLSDIDVHREQAPERGAFFPANDGEALADLMWRQWQAYSPDLESTKMAEALRRLPGRRLAFAQTYAAIVAEAIARKGGGP